MACQEPSQHSKDAPSKITVLEGLLDVDAKKINAIAGPWIDNEFHSKVYPQLDQAGIPVFRQETLPLTRLYDDDYWGELRAAHRIDFAILDYHHWQYNDDVFDKYLERVASVRFPILCIAECPFGFERPLQVAPEDFAAKLFERTRKISTAIREKHSNTVLLSPGIGLIDENLSRLYLDYFMHNRQFFDGYAVHVCNNMRDYALGQVSSFLSEVLSILPKKLWITKWCIPAFDDKIVNAQVVVPSGWEPFRTRDAAQRLERSFAFIETLASVGSHWFYTGTGKDYYKPRRKAGPVEFWDSVSSSVTPQKYSYDWEYRHFLGLLNSDGEIKQLLLQALVQMARYKNEY